MYPQDDPFGAPPPPPKKDYFKIVASVVIGLLILVIVSAITGGLGFWIGYSMNPLVDKGNSASPTPTPSVVVPISTPAATATPTPTPTPTPDIGGKYTGKGGDVEISNVTDKTVSFSINVGNADGTGHVDGQAARTSPTVAVYSKIPDMELYNDPDSMYYKKKCRITLRFSAGKVVVSEDDFACSYWHGAAIDFNGSFSQEKK